MKIYEDRVREFGKGVSTFTQKISILSRLRLFSALLFIGSGFGYWKTGHSIYLVLIASGIAAFILFVRKQWSINRMLELEQALLKINQDEASIVSGKFNPYDDGHDYYSIGHPYASDLDIFGAHSLFQYLNRTGTSIGKERLSVLLSARLSDDRIRENQEAIKELSSKINWRHRLLAHAQLMNDDKEKSTRFINWSKSGSAPFNRWLRFTAFLLPALFVATLIQFAIDGGYIWLKLSGLIFTFSLIVLVSRLKYILHEVASFEKVKESFYHYGILFKLVEDEKFESPYLKELQSALIAPGDSAGSKIKKLALIIESLSSVQNLVGAVLFNGVSLFHLHVYYSLLKWKIENAHSIEKWLDVIGEIESINSLSNFSYNNSSYCFPEITLAESFRFNDLGHPLISQWKRINNNIEFEKHSFIILTGSNMSGKSTFLRALGVNLVLANCGAPVCATGGSIRPKDILVSMRVDDSLADSQSYFFAEISRLKKITEHIDGKNTFVILDEILRGTNSDDKRSGTVHLMEKMETKGALGIIATHDIEVCRITDQSPYFFSNKCFEVEIRNDELYFDYKLRDGICRNKSATFLMRKAGVI